MDVDVDAAVEQAAALARVHRQLRSGQARLIRRSAGISQRQVAKMLGVQRHAVSRWEAGVRQPRPDTALALARILRELEP